MTKKAKITSILQYFKKNQPDVASELHYRNAYELLIATMLSAQCTDRRVNMVTPLLFAQYPAPGDMARASVDSLLKLIHSISYPNSKAAHLIATGKMIVEKFDGQVPKTMEELIQLPGVGRKTANVLLAFAFNLPAMPVDTHVFRVSNRLGIVNKAKTPTDVEKQLKKLIPETMLTKAHHWLLLHGRHVCTARRPHCNECPFTDLCDFYHETLLRDPSVTK